MKAAKRWRVACRVAGHVSRRTILPKTTRYGLINRIEPAPVTGTRHVFTLSAREPTIYALSTAPGKAAIAVIRISGPASLDVYKKLCPGRPLPKPRYATVRTLYEPNNDPTPNNVLDSSVLVLHFSAPLTATGEDVLELHVHGGQATVKAVLAAIAKCSASGDIRYAESGEFTRRAFMNDRLDLTQVEALGDVLSAMTEQQRKLSVRGTGSNLSKRYEVWRRLLLYARGELEALIDFSEDQHFDESPADLCASVSEQVEALKSKLLVYSQNAVRGEMLRHGISISLLGAPNAGKSSLLNRVVGREAAIVSQEAGTTRDVVEVGLDLEGYFCRLGDTAGLRKAREEAMAGHYKQEIISQIEQEGMRRAKQRATESDVLVVVLSLEQVGNDVRLHLEPEVIATALSLISSKNNVIVAINKSDLITPQDHENVILEACTALPALSKDRIHLISCKDSSSTSNIQPFLHGLATLFSTLTSALQPSTTEEADPSIWQESLGASTRHRILLEQCTAHLEDYLSTVNPLSSSSTDSEATAQEVDIVLAAEHLRHAAGCLARITGKGEDSGDVEEVLGVVFEEFCVGK